MITPLAGHPDSRRLEPLWDRVDKNRWRLVRYLFFFWLVSSVWSGLAVWVIARLLLVALAILGRSGSLGPPTVLQSWIGGGAASALYVWWSLARSERWLVRKLDAGFVPKGELYDTKMMVKDMAIAAGMKVAPALYSLPVTNVNAFVFHAIGRRPLLGVTDGLVNKFSLEEQRAVFANLIARVITGDTMVASAAIALMSPLHAARDMRIDVMNAEDDMLARAWEKNREIERKRRVKAEPAYATLMLMMFGPPIVLLGEVIAAAFRRSQLTGAEKADAEGMLLLKDPQPMITALERCVRLDNTVVSAGEGLGPLFYCWTGVSTSGDDDPEWRRVARLREVLGVEGHVFDEPVDQDLFVPPAPRLVEAPSERGGAV